MCSTISVKVSAAIAWSSTHHVESDDICDGLETVFALLLDKLHLGLENSFEGRCKGVKGCAEAQKSVLHISCFQLCFWQLLATFSSLPSRLGRYRPTDFCCVFFHLNAACLIRKWAKWELWYLIRVVKFILIQRENATVLCSDGFI